MGKGGFALCAQRRPGQGERAFLKAQGFGFLEAHHIVPQSRGGIATDCVWWDPLWHDWFHALMDNMTITEIRQFIECLCRPNLGFVEYKDIVTFRRLIVDKGANYATRWFTRLYKHKRRETVWPKFFLSCWKRFFGELFGSDAMLFVSRVSIPGAVFTDKNFCSLRQGMEEKRQRR